MVQQRVDPDLEKSIIDYENQERQLQVLLLQKNQFQMQLNEISLASEELKKSSGDVYKSIGSIMLKSNRDEAEKDLKERKELITIRLTTIEKQEEKLRGSLLTLQKKLQERMKGMDVGASGVA